ncbi:hypothetical protein Mal64_22770 [Pseudobythopirellula maris]|uniref:Uncharacterized protein n=1 Tax=Pseudobythopirellula maris TaxID=2527991 RepID=A0A5C5ZMX9_9BACT|nr:hypothetical protein [Pseudobythopirellula maris]TWT88789.1 hypothetical protein Mal64_22770 [Pseudobythopirellula maris]
MRRPHLLMLICLAAPAVGCSSWGMAKYDMSKYRDERAVSIDKRLASRPEVVKSPFEAADDRASGGAPDGAGDRL